MEPSLQPSFIFPSRQKNVDYARGLLDVSAATQRTLVWPSKNTNIDIQTSLQSPLTRPPTMDNGNLDARPVLPVDTPLYVQPGLAEGMADLARLTKADTDISKLTSANNALKRGNYKAAEHILGRQVTTEEQQNLTITPNFLSSEANPNVRTHVDFTTGARGERIQAQSSANMEKKIRSFGNASEGLVNDLAIRHGISASAARQLKTSLNFTGDSAVGYTESSEEEKQEILDAMNYFYKRTLGLTPAERKRAAYEASNMEGENRPVHSGKKASVAQQKYQAQYAEALRRGAMVGVPQPPPQAQFPNRNPDSAFSENYDPQRREREQEEKFQRNYYEQPQDMGDDIPEAPDFGPNPDLEMKDNEFQGAPQSIQEQLSRPTPLRPVSSATGPPVLNQQAVDFVQTNIPLNSNLQSQINEAKGRLRGTPERVTVTAPDRPINEEFKTEMDRRMRERRQRMDDDEGWTDAERDMDAALDLLDEVNTHPPEDEYAEGKSDDDEKMTTGRKRSNSSVSDNEMGGGIGGRKRPRRTTKRQQFHAPSNNFLPDTSSFSDRGAVVSGKLMQQTGKRAIPISAQIQVQETHQFTETPIREWVKHPNYASETRPDPIPISQSTGSGVGKRSRKVKFGGYMMDHNKLLTHNVLSLSHPSGKKVKGMPNMEVTPALKQVIHSIVTGGKVSTGKLKANEKLYLRDLMHKSAANVELGADVNVSPTQQLQLILGEMEAGNDSTELKSQLRKLLPQLKRSKVLTAEQVSDISKHYL